MSTGHVEKESFPHKLVRLRPREHPLARETQRPATDRIGERGGLGQELPRAAIAVGFFPWVYRINLALADRYAERRAAFPVRVVARRCAPSADWGG